MFPAGELGCALLLYGPYAIIGAATLARLPQLFIIFLAALLWSYLLVYCLTALLFESIRPPTAVAWSPWCTPAPPVHWLVPMQVVLWLFQQLCVFASRSLLILVLLRANQWLRRDHQVLVECDFRFTPVGCAVGLGYGAASMLLSSGPLLSATRSFGAAASGVTAYDLHVCPGVPLIFFRCTQSLLYTFANAAWGIVHGIAIAALYQQGFLASSPENGGGVPLLARASPPSRAAVPVSKDDGAESAEPREVPPPLAPRRDGDDAALDDLPMDPAPETTKKAVAPGSGRGSPLYGSPRRAAAASAAPDIPSDSVFSRYDPSVSYIALLTVCALQLLFTGITLRLRGDAASRGAFQCATRATTPNQGCMMSLPLQLVITTFSGLMALWMVRQEFRPIAYRRQGAQLVVSVGLAANDGIVVLERVTIIKPYDLSAEHHSARHMDAVAAVFFFSFLFFWGVCVCHSSPASLSCTRRPHRLGLEVKAIGDWRFIRLPYFSHPFKDSPTAHAHSQQLKNAAPVSCTTTAHTSLVGQSNQFCAESIHPFFFCFFTFSPSELGLPFKLFWANCFSASIIIIIIIIIIIVDLDAPRLTSLYAMCAVPPLFVDPAASCLCERSGSAANILAGCSSGGKAEGASPLRPLIRPAARSRPIPTAAGLAGSPSPTADAAEGGAADSKPKATKKKKKKSKRMTSQPAGLLPAAASGNALLVPPLSLDGAIAAAFVPPLGRTTSRRQRSFLVTGAKSSVERATPRSSLGGGRVWGAEVPGAAPVPDPVAQFDLHELQAVAHKKRYLRKAASHFTARLYPFSASASASAPATPTSASTSSSALGGLLASPLSRGWSAPSSTRAPVALVLRHVSQLAADSMARTDAGGSESEHIGNETQLEAAARLVAEFVRDHWLLGVDVRDRPAAGLNYAALQLPPDTDAACGVAAELLLTEGNEGAPPLSVLAEPEVPETGRRCRSRPATARRGAASAPVLRSMGKDEPNALTPSAAPSEPDPAGAGVASPVSAARAVSPRAAAVPRLPPSSAGPTTGTPRDYQQKIDRLRFFASGRRPSVDPGLDPEAATEPPLFIYHVLDPTAPLPGEEGSSWIDGLCRPEVYMRWRYLWEAQCRAAGLAAAPLINLYVLRCPPSRITGDCVVLPDAGSPSRLHGDTLRVRPVPRTWSSLYRFLHSTGALPRHGASDDAPQGAVPVPMPTPAASTRCSRGRLYIAAATSALAAHTAPAPPPPASAAGAGAAPHPLHTQFLSAEAAKAQRDLIRARLLAAADAGPTTGQQLAREPPAVSSGRSFAACGGGQTLPPSDDGLEDGDSAWHYGLSSQATTAAPRELSSHEESDEEDDLEVITVPTALPAPAVASWRCVPPRDENEIHRPPHHFTPFSFLSFFFFSTVGALRFLLFNTENCAIYIYIYIYILLLSVPLSIMNI
eukprot:gene12113-8337_t